MAASFVQAVICPNKLEYQLVEKLARGACCPKTYDISYVFQAILGKHLVHPVLFLDMAWKDCGLTSFISFTHIRSSVSTQVITIFYLNSDMTVGNLEDF